MGARIHSSPRRALFSCPPNQPGSQDMQFGFAHGPFQAQQQAVIEVGGIVESIFMSLTMVYPPPEGQITKVIPPPFHQGNSPRGSPR